MIFRPEVTRTEPSEGVGHSAGRGEGSRLISAYTLRTKTWSSDEHSQNQTYEDDNDDADAEESECGPEVGCGEGG